MLGRIIAAVLIVIGVGAGYYAGHVTGVQAGEAQARQVQSRFFANRGGTGAGGNAGGGQGRTGANGGQAVSGTVTTINGTTITLKMNDNTTTTVQLNANVQIHKQAVGQVSDIHTGDRIVAIGTKSGNVLQATSVQLGGAGGGRFGGPTAAGQQ